MHRKLTILSLLWFIAHRLGHGLVGPNFRERKTFMHGIRLLHIIAPAWMPILRLGTFAPWAPLLADGWSSLLYACSCIHTKVWLLVCPLMGPLVPGWSVNFANEALFLGFTRPSFSIINSNDLLHLWNLQQKVIYKNFWEKLFNMHPYLVHRIGRAHW